jgi:hypothetical protein
MKREFILAIGMVSILTCTPVCLAQQVKLEPVEWSDIWIADTSNLDRPRILLVGDSISKGYYDRVEMRLSGRANCARYATSRFLGNPDYLAELILILKRYKFEVIHINNGLHGWDHSEKEYKEGLHALLATIKHYAPKAKLIWCMTTPLRTAENLAQLSSKGNNRVIERNRIAAEIMDRNKVQINNLYEAMKDHPEYYLKDGIHFNPKGMIVQGDRVAELIEKYLPREPDS